LERSDDPGKRDIQVNGRFPKRRKMLLGLIKHLRGKQMGKG
jgi:hypothetical protein